MTPHTPTPWRVTDDGLFIVEGPESMAEPPRCVACSPSPHPWRRADAELIVRAVNSHADLLAALQACTDYFNHTRSGREWRDAGGEEPEIVRAAIAKAKGAT